MLALMLCLLLQEPPLSTEERTLLNLPFKDGLFDPGATKAQRVIGTATLRTCYGKKKSVEASAWRVPAQGDRPERFVLNSCQEVPALEDWKPMPFLAESFEKESKMPAIADIDLFGSYLDAQRFVWAAWLHRLGRDEEAAKILRMRKTENIHGLFRTAFSWQLFSHAVNAYIVGDDEQAVPSLERLVQLDSRYQQQGKDLQAELRRRQTMGTFGKRSLPLPEDIRTWPFQKRIDRLVESLDQIDTDMDYGNFTRLDDQPPARELLACGEAAVPALLKCIQEDPRLTRCVATWREWSPFRSVLSVRGAAAIVLSAILRTEHWDPRAQAQAFEDAAGGERWALLLNRYWQELGKFPFPERMMRVLQDRASTVEAMREASENLARLERTPSLSRGPRWMPAEDPLIREPRPELASFKDPTVAEAILTAMDRHLKQVAGTGNWGEIEEERYLTWIGELGDRRIVAELLRRQTATKDPTSCRRYAFALRRLGAPGPLDELAKEVEKGREARDVAEATALVDALGRALTPACERALAAITRPEHPWYALTRAQLLQWDGTWESRPWFAHPYCLSFFRAALKEEAPTGGVLTFENGRTERCDAAGKYLSGFFYSGEVRLQSDPKARKEKAVERTCDVAAVVLAELIPTAPRYHPLLLDAEARLKEFRTFMDRNGDRLRRMTWEEAASRSPRWSAYYVVDR